MNSSKPFHDGGSGSSMPYPTASTLSQLIADTNYVNQVGGAITIGILVGNSAIPF